MKIKRNYNIDLVKSIAYIGVVFLHVLGKTTSNGYSGTIFDQILYNLGTLSVPLFFVTNGYLLLGKQNTNYKYSVNKIVNLLITVLCWNILYSVVTLLITKQFENPITLSLYSLLQKGFFYQFWFIGSLVICYLLLPILNSIWHKHFKILIALFLICLLIALMLDFRNMVVVGNPIQMKVIQTFRIWTWLMYYILGGLLKKISNQLKKIPSIISLIFVGMMLTYEYFIKYQHNTGFAEYNYDNLLIILTVVITFVTVLKINIPSKFDNYILFLSQNGFGVFIVHLLFLKIMGKILNLENPLQNSIGLIFVLVGAYLTSYIISKIPVLKKIVLR